MFCTVYFDSFFNKQNWLKKYPKKTFMVLEHFKPTDGKCQNWSTISRWKGEIASSFFAMQWLANGWILSQCCFYHLSFKEWLTYYQFGGEKRVQRQSLWLLVLKLSKYTIAAWMELVLWTSVLPYNVWIERHLLVFTSAFCLIWCISHMSIVTSFITWNILKNCLSLITRLLSQNT